MTKFRLTWCEKQLWVSIVEANSKEEAMEKHFNEDSDELNNNAEAIENEYITGSVMCEEYEE